MDLSTIRSRIDTVATSLEHVVVSSPGDTRSDVDTEKELNTILKTAYANDVWPVNAGTEPGSPTVVYRLLGVAQVAIDGHPIAFIDQFQVVVRASGYASVMAAVTAIKTAVDASTWGVQIDDESDGEFDDDLNLTERTLDIQFITPALPGESSDLTPCVVIYPISDDAAESQYATCVKQPVTSTFGVAIITGNSDIEDLRAEVFTAIHGWEPASGYDPIELRRGESAGRIGGMDVWRDVFVTTHWLKNGA